MANGRAAAEPVEVVRALIAALNRGAIDEALLLCADDIVLWAPGDDLAGQMVHGKEALRQQLEFSEAAWPGTWTSIDAIVAEGERVALEMTIVVSSEGASVVQPMSAFYTVRDGLVVTQRSYFDLGALDRSLSE
ncbi:MAG TPA: nuclear transport factor 2 family protein [Nitrolancea sp.]|nr:nuclear transport factor 2 family protein [Nitrolancea sp.]